MLFTLRLRHLSHSGTAPLKFETSCQHPWPDRL